MCKWRDVQKQSGDVGGRRGLSGERTGMRTCRINAEGRQEEQLDVGK